MWPPKGSTGIQRLPLQTRTLTHVHVPRDDARRRQNNLPFLLALLSTRTLRPEMDAHVSNLSSSHIWAKRVFLGGATILEPWNEKHENENVGKTLEWRAYI